jgi:hypothetical protein
MGSATVRYRGEPRSGMNNSEQQAGNGNPAKNDADSDKDGATNVFAATERQLQSIGDSSKTGGDKQAKHNADILRINRRTFWAVFIYALLTFGILITNSCQMRETRRAANAATDQARIAEDTEKRQLRPYVNIATGALYNSSPHEATPEWHLPIEVENNGATQTKGAVSELWCVPDSFVNDDPMKNAGAGRIQRFFGPKQKSGIGSCVYTPDELDEAKSNASHLHVAAKIIYTDTLGGEIPHITEFCVELVGIKGNFSKPEGGAISTLVCNSHNCADDECPKEDLE